LKDDKSLKTDQGNTINDVRNMYKNLDNGEEKEAERGEGRKWIKDGQTGWSL
jgi:hypothetical protein